MGKIQGNAGVHCEYGDVLEGCNYILLAEERYNVCRGNLILLFDKSF